MSISFNKSLGTRLRALRKLRGLTQQQLARHMGVTFQQVQKYESGANSLTFERICFLSALLRVPLHSWLEEEWIGAPPMAGEENRQSLHLLQAYHAISRPEHKALLCTMARALGAASHHARPNAERSG